MQRPNSRDSDVLRPDLYQSINGTAVCEPPSRPKRQGNNKPHDAKPSNGTSPKPDNGKNGDVVFLTTDPVLTHEMNRLKLRVVGADNPGQHDHMLRDRSVIVPYRGPEGFTAADVAARHTLDSNSPERVATLDMSEVGFCEDSEKFVAWHSKNLDFVRLAQEKARTVHKLPATEDDSPSEHCDTVYRAILGALELSAEHRDDLVRRGHSEAWIGSSGYRTLPSGDRQELAAKVLVSTGLAESDLLKVPGFGRNRSSLTVYGAAGLLIPVKDASGKLVGCQIRPDHKEHHANGNGNGKLSKYVWLSSSSAGGPSAKAHPHVAVVEQQNPPSKVRWTEGPLKANIAAEKSGVTTIGATGVANWKPALPISKDLGAKTVCLSFDSDSASKASVAKHLASAARAVIAAGYELECERWDGSSAKGIDDALVAGTKIEILAGLDAVTFALGTARSHGEESMVEADQIFAWAEWYLSRDLTTEIYDDLELIDASRDIDQVARGKLGALFKRHNFNAKDFFAAAKSANGGERKIATVGEKYVERNGKTYVRFTDAKDEVTEVQIANFTARIDREILRHEGTERHLQFVVDATHENLTEATVAVDATKYAEMAWVEQLGSIFTVSSGRGSRDQLREAIQIFSQKETGSARTLVAPRVEVYTSLGWQETNKGLTYLHAGGGIGPDGPVNVAVEPSPVLSKYLMPPPPQDPEVLKKAVDACLDILSLGKPDRPGSRGMAAILASLPFRAVLLGTNRSTCHFSGTHHVRKTAVALVGQGFFCFHPGEEATVTTTWESTPKSIQKLAFDTKDSLLVIDELTGERAIKVATDVIQAQGNERGGSRLTQTRGYGQTHDPRGSLLSTGEADPVRQSTLGRMLAVRFEKKTVDLVVLTRLQGHASEGLLALGMSGFIQWLAHPGRLEEARKKCRRLASDIVARAKTENCHMRHLSAAAELAASFKIFLGFAVEQGAIAEITALKAGDKIEADLLELAASQNEAQQEAEPAERFLCLLRSGMLSGRFHLRSADQNDFAPQPYAEACGWKKDWLYDGGTVGQRLEWKVPSISKQIGYVDVDKGVVLLDPELAKSVASTTGRDQGSEFENVNKLARDLVVAGVSKPTSMGGKTRYTVQHSVRGVRQRFIEIPLSKVFDIED
jgi:hypothetical protein